MPGNAWKRPLISTLALGVSMAVSLHAHAASEWKPGVPRTAYVTLFEWSWDSIAKECTNYLGPKGYAAVQVSPPQEHGPGGEWWRRYQPVSYKLASRSGNRQQFQNMVNTCHAAGVDVYVDTVINHMADYIGGTGTGGSGWSGRNFPAVPYSSDHFHNPKCDIAQADYNNNRNNVLNCDMPGLPDLNTGNAYVQEKIAAYMNDLLSLGVDGFRIDAAKHIAPADLAAIKARVPGNYFFTQEVIRDGSVGSATTGDLAAYQNLGTVNEFNFIYAMKNSFLNLYNFNLSRIPEAFSTWGFIPSNKATVFVNNHDTERKECTSYNVGSGICDSLSTLNQDKLYLANIFMLAYNYGYPSVASGYYFSNHDQGPSGQPYNGSETTPANCSSTFVSGKWDCVHRDRRVVNMVAFRNYTNGTAVSNWVAGDVNQVAFDRTGKGFVAINNSTNTWQKTFTTSLPNGTYCNVVAVDNTSSCSGNEFTVSGGQLTLSLAPGKAVALHIGARSGSTDLPPTVPGKPTVSNIASTSATVSWAASTDDNGVAGYRVYRNGTLAATTAGNVTTTNLTGLSPSTSYSITVKAFDTPGNVSAASQTTAFTTQGTGTSATVYYYSATWSTVYGYISGVTPNPGLRMSNACTNWKVRTESMQGYPSVSVTFNNGAGQKDPVRYTIRAGVNIVRNGVVTTGTNPCVGGTPTTPTNVTATVSGTSVNVTWEPSTDDLDVVGYYVYRNGVQVGRVTTPDFTDVSVQAGTWSYTVKAFDADNNVSPASAAASAIVQPPNQDVTITFKVSATTVMGENVYITGNNNALGNWSTAADAARKCSPAAYPIWSCTVTFPAGTSAIAYKYQIIGDSVRWETGADRTYTVPTAAATKEDGSFRQ